MKKYYHKYKDMNPSSPTFGLTKYVELNNLNYHMGDTITCGGPIIDCKPSHISFDQFLNKNNMPHYNKYIDNSTEELVIALYVPDYKKSYLDISILDNELTVVATLPEKDDQNYKIIYAGQYIDNFTFKHTIGEKIDSSVFAKATLEDGTLKIVFKLLQPTKIVIN